MRKWYPRYTISAVITNTIVVTETFAPTIPLDVSDAIVKHAYGAAYTLNAGSTPPATKKVQLRLLLSGGAGSIDLTSVLDQINGLVSLSGLKVQYFRVKALAANANAITVVFGDANPYLLAGAAWSQILQPGQAYTFEGNDATPDVGSGAKKIDFAGTGTQGVDITIIGG